MTETEKIIDICNVVPKNKLTPRADDPETKCDNIGFLERFAEAFGYTLDTESMTTNTQKAPDAQLSASSACSLLENEGWKECPDRLRKTARCFFKRFETPTRCRLNDDKWGMQVCVSVSHHEQWWGYEIDLAGELPDGTWIKLHNWSMPEKLKDGLETIPKLLETWEFISARTPKIRSDP